MLVVGRTYHGIDLGARSVHRARSTLVRAVAPPSGLPVEISGLGLAEHTFVGKKLYAGQCFHARCGYRQARPCVRNESAVVGRCADQFVLGD